MEPVNLMDVPAHMRMEQHASPMMFNRETRRKWQFRTNKKRGSGYTTKKVQIHGIHGSKVDAVDAEIGAMRLMFEKITFKKKEN